MPGRRLKRKKIIIGVTGAFGSGKSTVAAMLRSCGAQVIDADKLAHNCYRPGSRAYKKIVRLFGRGILGRDRQIERRKLGRRVFADRALLKKLNRIVHPQVKAMINSAIRQGKKRAVAIDAALLLEAGLRRAVDKLVVVTAGKKQESARIKKRDGLSAQEIRRRRAAQVPLQHKVAFADFIIDNSGKKEKTKKEVKKIWRELWRN